MGHGYESTSVAEIRELLRGYGVDEETLQQTKKVLVELLIAYNTSGVKKEEIKIEKLVGNDVRGPVVKMPEYNDIYISPEALEDIKNWGNEDIPEEGKLDEEVEEDYLDSLTETPYDISSFNDLEVEITDDNTINIEGLEEVLEQINEENIEEEQEVPVVQTNDIQEVPKMFDIGWNDYLLSQLTDKEVYCSYPKCSGLKRLLYKYVGPILSKEIRSYISPTSDNKTSTVAVMIKCFVTNKKHPAYKQEIIEESIADSNLENNKDFPYSTHMSSVCERRAESRCYRNLLGLDMVSAEEMVGSTTTPGENNFTMTDLNNTGGINQVQILGINLVAKRLNINVFDFINAGSSGKKYEKITDIDSATASLMLQTLNEIASGKIQKPESVGEYKEGWDKV